MVKVTAQMVKELRDATGAGPRDCKEILTKTEGDVQKAIDMLKETVLSHMVLSVPLDEVIALMTEQFGESIKMQSDSVEAFKKGEPLQDSYGVDDIDSLFE